MITALVSALVTAIAALSVAILTMRNATQRDRESDWRKIKLDMYRDFISALSGIVEGRTTEASEIKYLDASHNLMLIASPDVLKMLYQFQHSQFDKRNLTPLMIAIRNDIKPRADRTDQGIEFQTFTFGSLMPQAQASAPQNLGDK